MAPRVASLSGNTLDLPRRLSPKARTTALCFCVHPITDPLSVTLILPAILKPIPYASFEVPSALPRLASTNSLVSRRSKASKVARMTLLWFRDPIVFATTF
jgi:hypothetical protein